MRRMPFLIAGLCLAACASGKAGSPSDAAQSTPGTGDTSSASGGNASTGGAPGSGGAIGSGGRSGTGGSSAKDAGADGNAPDTSIAVDSANDRGATPRLDAATDAGATSDDAQVACPAGYKLTWSDEFDGPAGTAADATKWVYESGNGSNGWGNSELEYYRTGNANAAMDGKGNLVITAKQETYSGFQYTSARLKTQGLATWTYGHIEARIKIPFGQGLWPAFWMLGDDIAKNAWPACGEIDVMENIGKEPTKIHGTLHGPGYSAGAGPTAIYTLPGSARFADDFHVFAIEWELNTIRWYVDGQLYSTKTTQDIGSGNTWVYAHPFFILLNLAVGGQWPGNPDTTTTFPQTMAIDYVRVCQK